MSLVYVGVNTGERKNFVDLFVDIKGKEISAEREGWNRKLFFLPHVCERFVSCAYAPLLLLQLLKLTRRRWPQR